jgi:glutaredoxin-like protein NrdH
MGITVYAKPFCVQCDATQRVLAKAGITYIVVDITQDPEALADLKRRGFAQAPVVITESDA